MMGVLALAGLAGAAEPPEPLHFFMPAIEVGVLVHADPGIRPGPLFRTSLDYRVRRLDAPFLRVTYDATTARTVREGGRLVANLALHDLLAGGGVRFGSTDLQVVGSLQAGGQLAELPLLRETTDTGLVVDTETRFAGMAAAGVGVEVYFDEDIALTADLSGRVRSSAFAPGASPLAGAFTLGLTTAL